MPRCYAIQSVLTDILLFVHRAGRYFLRSYRFSPRAAYQDSIVESCSLCDLRILRWSRFIQFLNTALSRIS